MPFIRGTPGNDRIFGSDEDDFIQAGDGDDLVHGRAGDDWLEGEGGNDTLIGGEGDDFLVDGEGDDLLLGGSGSDLLSSVGGDDTLIGGDGNDFFNIDGSGHAVVVGGDGTDRLSLYGRNAVVNFETGTATAIGADGQVLTVELHGFEEYVHGGFDGGHITGSSGNDLLIGSGGDDTIISGAGNDTVSGHIDGNDLYIFNVAPGEANADVVMGFSKHEFEGFDTVVLDSSVMPELGALGDFSADDERFYAAAGATGGAEADDRVIYDTQSGRLYYDADGSGEGEAQILATFTRIFLGDLAAGDFAVI